MACANGHLEVVKLLLVNKAPLDALNKAMNTPLHWAALNGRLPIVELLLESGADPNLMNEFGRMPLEEAL